MSPEMRSWCPMDSDVPWVREGDTEKSISREEKEHMSELDRERKSMWMVIMR